MRWKVIFSVLALLCAAFFFVPTKTCDTIVVTHGAHGGRFGDNLLSLLHAKYLAYKMGLPFAYRPFPGFECLQGSQSETLLTNEKQYKKRLYHPGMTLQKGKRPLLLELAYFPETPVELAPFGAYSYFFTDWKDPAFRRLVKEITAPLKPLHTLTLSKEHFNVALHVRWGSGDDDETMHLRIPTKFPPLDFYVESLKTLCKIDARPLFVFLFTDHARPLELKQALEEKLKGYPLEIVCREDNAYQATMLEDFFAMQQFEAMVRPVSSFSQAAAIIGEVRLEIYPTASQVIEGAPVITSSCMTNNGPQTNSL